MLPILDIDCIVVGIFFQIFKTLKYYLFNPKMINLQNKSKVLIVFFIRFVILKIVLEVSSVKKWLTIKFYWLKVK